MRKEKEKKNGNIRNIILSVVISVVLWVVIGVIQDPDVHGTVTNIPIEYMNADTLEENGLVVVQSANKVDVTAQISGKRRDLMESSKNVKLVVDVSDITEAGDYTLEGSVTTTSSRITVERGRSMTIPVHIETIVSKDFPVTVKQIGVSKNSIIKSDASIETVKISGAVSEIENISEVKAELDISEIVQDGDRYAVLTPVTENGMPIRRDSTINMSATRVTVKNTVYERVTLPIKIRLNSKLANDYWLDEKSSTLSVSSVEVGLLKDSTADRVYLDISSLQEDNSTYKLTQGEGMYIPDENIQVEAQIKLVKKIARHADVTVTAKNAQDGLNVTMTEKITGVLLYAPEEVFNSGDISGTVDLEGKTQGTYRLKVELDDERVTSADEIYADVVIAG